MKQLSITAILLIVSIGAFGQQADTAKVDTNEYSVFWHTGIFKGSYIHKKNDRTYILNCDTVSKEPLVLKCDTDWLPNITTTLSTPSLNNYFSYGSLNHTPDSIVSCLYLTYPNQWHRGYIKLIEGHIKAEHVMWAMEYANMAVGYFTNPFYNQKHKLIHPKVLSVIITK